MPNILRKDITPSNLNVSLIGKVRSIQSGLQTGGTYTGGGGAAGKSFIPITVLDPKKCVASLSASMQTTSTVTYVWPYVEQITKSSLVIYGGGYNSSGVWVPLPFYWFLVEYE